MFNELLIMLKEIFVKRLLNALLCKGLHLLFDDVSTLHTMARCPFLTIWLLRIRQIYLRYLPTLCKGSPCTLVNCIILESTLSRTCTSSIIVDASFSVSLHYSNEKTSSHSDVVARIQAAKKIH